ncbi:MAG: hypothetical protein RIQ94_2426 [Pseudomonadota bacterium]|jgi:putative chitinase
MLLKNGSTGDDVKKVQAKLCLEADGDFGSDTEAKVKQWQAEHGLVADGVVGNKSWAVLFEIEKDNHEPEDDDEIVSALDDTTVSHSVFNLANLRGHVPDDVIKQIPDAAAKFHITTPLRLAHFLAQCAHESGQFKVLSENLNYSAQGLRKIFPHRFSNDAIANAYAHQREKIGNRAYADKNGNGNEASGEGYKFRGRGYIQLTGKSNYTGFANFINDPMILTNPDLIETKYPLASAAFFFNNHPHLWLACDEGATDAVVTKVTRYVNGGVNGLSDRIRYFKKYHALL